MILAALLLLQLTLEQKSTLEAGVLDIKAIDSEIEQIRDHQDELRGSAAAREDEIISLRSRYPEIVLSKGATVERIYRALYDVRVARAEKLRPLSQENKRAVHAESCEAARKVQRMRAEIEQSDGYKKMTLAERLAWRTDMDSYAPASDCALYDK